MVSVGAWAIILLLAATTPIAKPIFLFIALAFALFGGGLAAAIGGGLVILIGIVAAAAYVGAIFATFIAAFVTFRRTANLTEAFDILAISVNLTALPLALRLVLADAQLF